MTTQQQPPSPSASGEHRTGYRRLVLAAARGDSLGTIAEIGLSAACRGGDWPVGQVQLIEEWHGDRLRLTTLARFGTGGRPDLAGALCDDVAEPGSPVATTAHAGRAYRSEPDGQGVVRLVAPLTHGDVVGVIELLDDRARTVDADQLTQLTDLTEVLGAAAARHREWGHEGGEGRVEPEDEAARAVRERLELDQQRLREAEKIGSFGVWELLPGREFTWSAELCRIHGVEPDFLPTLEANISLIHPDDLPVIDTYMSHMRTEHAGPPVQYRIRRPSGEIRWVESHVKVLEGNRTIGITRDVTDQRAREEREHLQAQIAQRMVEGVTLVKGDGTILYANPQYANLFDLLPEQVEGSCIWDHVAPEHHPPAGEVFLQNGFHGEVRHVRPDGSVFTTEANITEMPIPAGEPGERAWLAVERDITEEKAKAAALRDREERLALIQQHAPIGLALTDLDAGFVQINPALCAISGRSVEELHKDSLVGIIHPRDAACLHRELGRLVKGELDLVDTERRIVRPDGTTVWVALKVASARDERGAARYLVAQVVDIETRKQAEQAQARHAAELERSNAELRRAKAEAERANQAKNEFLSRMSHELRTPLNAVLGFAQLLGLEELESTQLDMVDQVLRGGRHLLILIDEILDIARMENGTMSIVVEPVDVVAAVDHACSLLDPLVRETGVQVEVVSGNGPAPVVAADRQRFVQILLNLLSNAIKYNVPRGRVTVRVSGRDGRVSVSVIDTGPGIAREELSRLFEPFDRLGAEQTDIEGTGIGLTVSRSLAHQMGGHLTVESTVGEGSTFTLDLPLHEPAPIS
jgi:PAS domain S-box-containing protein